MKEGWNGDEYLVLFEEDEFAAASERYDISRWLPGFEVVGLCGWDDLIVRDQLHQIYSVPAVPLSSKYLQPYHPSNPAMSLESDSRFTGKIKWYTKPIVFGGDPNYGDNLVWVDHAQHGQLVKWWNDQYHALKSAGA